MASSLRSLFSRIIKTGKLTVRGAGGEDSFGNGGGRSVSIRFTDAAGKTLVEGVTTWALLDRASGRLLRVRPEIAAPFLEG